MCKTERQNNVLDYVLIYAEIIVLAQRFTYTIKTDYYDLNMNWKKKKYKSSNGLWK